MGEKIFLFFVAFRIQYWHPVRIVCSCYNSICTVSSMLLRFEGVSKTSSKRHQNHHRVVFYTLFSLRSSEADRRIVKSSFIFKLYLRSLKCFVSLLRTLCRTNQFILTITNFMTLNESIPLNRDPY